MAISACTLGTVMADDITADVLTYDGKTKTVTAKGNVVIHANQGATITAKNGQYHFEDRSAFLDGGVHYVKDSSTLDAQKMFLYKDKTTRGVGNVYFHDSVEKRILKGDDVIYNPDTGFGKIEGNGYLEDSQGTLAAPHIEGNMKQVKVVATGGVDLTSSANNAVGYGDKAVYTRTGRDGKDGKLVLSGNAWVNQNGNTFNGPELVLRDADKVVETSGRSTIVITNTGSENSENSASSGESEPSAPKAPVTEATPIEGRPDIPANPLETKEPK
jgi:lipopolysaccharide export system protein LptA